MTTSLRQMAFYLLIIFTLDACAGCNDSGSGESDSIRSLGDASPNNGSDAGSDTIGGGSTDDVSSTDSDNENDTDVLIPDGCGDGIVEPPEACDDGNNDLGDYCALDCSAETGACGDAIVQSNEVCDDGNTTDDGDCNAACTATITSVCGDGTVDQNEVCDDGNTANGDYCSADCAATSGACGDGTIQTNEICDDANTTDDDYCSADCTTATGSCGDQIVQANETCDDGTTANCSGTQNDGTGTCGPIGQCANGYVLDAGGNCITNPTGLSVPCENGPGWTLFKFHWDNGSTSARIDVWDATCSYSFAPNSACNVRAIYPGFGDVSTTSQGFPIFTSSNYMRVRFNVNGLNFSTATLWVKGRSYSTGASTYFDVWSPLYGEREGGPVDNDFVYEWSSLDWTGNLFPSDQPSLTAIQLYGGRGSGSLAVQAVEMCVQ